MFFALFYNIMGMPIAARVFAGLGVILSPELAGLAMALSSISVVSNSLLLQSYKPGKKNTLSVIAPGVMIILFSFIFFEFTKLSSGMMTNKKIMNVTLSRESKTYIDQLLKNQKNKSYFVGKENKMFLEITQIDPQHLLLSEGVVQLKDNEMILGFDEGMMMKEEKLIQKTGDRLTDFFGVPTMKVVGILKPTGTKLDKYHLVNSNTFKRLTGNLK